jgi:hypothetical protein
MNVGLVPARVLPASTVIRFKLGERFTFHAVSEPMNRKLKTIYMTKRRAVR